MAGALIARALSAYRRLGFAEAGLVVEGSNADAVSLYTRLGFVDSGRGYVGLTAPIP